MLDLNPTHPKILTIAEIYIDLFDFRKRRLSRFVQNSKEIMKRNLKKVDLKIDLFDATSCAVFLSLNTRLIVHASNSAEAFFKSPVSDLIGKPYGYILPDFMRDTFKMYIDRLIEEGNMEHMKIGEFFTFFKEVTQARRIIVPAYLRTKIDIV